MEKVGSNVVYKMREHFHRQRRNRPEQAVDLKIVLQNELGAIIAIDANDQSLYPLRLLDAQDSLYWSIDANDSDIMVFLDEAIDEHKINSIGLTKEEKYELMVKIIERKISSLDIT